MIELWSDKNWECAAKKCRRIVFIGNCSLLPACIANIYLLMVIWNKNLCLYVYSVTCIVAWVTCQTALTDSLQSTIGKMYFWLAFKIENLFVCRSQRIPNSKSLCLKLSQTFVFLSQKKFLIENHSPRKKVQCRLKKHLKDYRLMNRVTIMTCYKKMQYSADFAILDISASSHHSDRWLTKGPAFAEIANGR